MLLGGLLLDGSAWDRAGDLLSDSDFYRTGTAPHLRTAVGSLINATKPADVITRSSRQLQSLGQRPKTAVAWST
jgi:replicative DNA helicase